MRIAHSQIDLLLYSNLVHGLNAIGITDVIELIATRKGTIRPIQSLVQILSSACSI